MFFPLIFWIVLPFLIGWLLVRWIKKHGPLPVPPDVAALYARSPIEPKRFRAARRDASGLTLLGDREKRMEAVDLAYHGLEEARKAGRKASFLVFNDEAELLEQVDS